MYIVLKLKISKYYTTVSISYEMFKDIFNKIDKSLKIPTKMEQSLLVCVINFYFLKYKWIFMI